MHPILAHLRRLALYLLAWIPIALLLAYLLGMAHTIRWQEAVAVAFPLCLVYAFVCLSAWYSCRVTPLERSSFSRLFLTHLTTALLATALWVIIAKVLVIELSQTSRAPDLELRFAPEIPILVGTGILLYLLSIAFHYVLLALEASKEAEARVMKAG